ncbi:hypothetical protein GOBAR_AA01481 [Gossypium barbadense]|uniref:Uncharacterized protein n=1 Tax=Gossypium barbadense TaxID=3634 RepID=A0A2P5YU15_GOSBA|nr:hypothetical protein GOBAR_AA01481 [Gossypium barbadense]
MLTKFISVSETCFQNTKIALKNQQALIRGLETQIGQLAKLISKRPQGSLPSNTESNPREQLNAIIIHDNKGLVALEPEPRQETVTHRPRIHDKPKPRHDELNDAPNQLKVGDKVLLDAADPRIATSEPNEEIPLTVLSIFPFGTVEALNTPVPIPRSRHCQPNTSVGKANEVRHDRATRSCAPISPRNTSVGRISDTPNFKIRETHGQKLGHTGMPHGRVPQNLYKPLTIHHLPPQKSLTLAAVTPHALPATLFSSLHLVRESHEIFLISFVFPCYFWDVLVELKLSNVGTMSSSRGKKTVVPASKKRKGAVSSSGLTAEIRHPFLQIQLADAIRALLTIDPWGLFFEIVEPMYLEFKLELYLTFHLQTAMTKFDDPGTVQFYLGGLVCQLSVPKKTREHRRRHHPRCLLLMEHGEWTRPRPRLPHRPRHLRSDGVTSEGGHLYRALCDSIGSALQAPQYSSTIILPHSHWPDVPTGHLEHSKYEDDRETMWHLPSLVLPRPVHQGGGPRRH